MINMAVQTRLSNVNMHVKATLKCYQIGNVAEFGRHSLNEFEVIQLFSEGKSQQMKNCEDRF